MNFLKSAQPSMFDRIWFVVRYPYDIVRNPVNTLLSSPTLSFLLIPTFSSYSTSLNLLFFYVTWSTLILSNSPLKVEILGTLAIRVLFYVLPALGFLAFDGAASNLAVKVKEHGETALPMGEEQGGPKGPWWKVALISTANVLLGVLIQSSVELLFTKVLHIRSALKISTSLPMPWSIAIDLIRGLFLREVGSLLSLPIHFSVLIRIILDPELCYTSLRFAPSRFTNYRLSHDLATRNLRSLLIRCKLRSPSSLRHSSLSPHISSCTALPVPSLNVSYVSSSCLPGRDARL